MKVFLCAGKQAKSMGKVVSEQFTGYAQVLSGSTLEDIDKAFVLGNVFERVLVTEAAWTIDGRVTEEREIRKRINDLSVRVSERGGGEQYVFLTRSFEQAEICVDETSEIRDRAAVVLYAGVGSAAVIGELLDRDIALLRDNLRHKPADIEVESDLEVDVDVSDINLPEFGTAVQRGAARATHISGSQAVRDVNKTPWFAGERHVGGSGGGFGTADFNAPVQEAAPDYDNFGDFDDSDGFGGADDFADFGADSAAAQPIGYDDEFMNAARDDGLYAIDAATGFEVAAEVEPQDVGRLSELFAPGAQLNGTALSAAQRHSTATPATKSLNEVLDAAKGLHLLFTGAGGAGTTTLAFNTAYRLCALGYRVMLVDGDLEGKGLQYITSLGVCGEDILSADTAPRSLMNGLSLFSAAAFGGSNGWAMPDKLMARFDFVVYDAPLKSLCFEADAALGDAGSVVIVTDSGTWGVTKTALALSALPADYASPLCGKASLLLNKSDKMDAKLLGQPALDADAVQGIVERVLPDKAEPFISLPIIGSIGTYSSAEDCWFSEDALAARSMKASIDLILASLRV